MELNDMDWKSGLSDKSERLAQHISAFANYTGGGFMAFGVANDGVINPLINASARLQRVLLHQFNNSTSNSPFCLV